MECGAPPACQDLSCASAWSSRKGGIPLAKGAGRRRHASHVKSGQNKNVCREAGAVLADWEQTWASLVSLSHHFHFCGATRDAWSWRLWWQAGATCSHLLLGQLGHVPAQGSLSIFTSAAHAAAGRKATAPPERSYLQHFMNDPKASAVCLSVGRQSLVWSRCAGVCVRVCAQLEQPHPTQCQSCLLPQTLLQSWGETDVT